MNQKINLVGKAHKYGDHIDTDVIIPARLLNNPDPEVMGQHCMEDIDPNFAKKVKKGDIMVGGVNFGCGSSREHAPVAIRAAGISCVIAKNFARIFYRNAINIGLPLLESSEAVDAISDGDELDANIDTGTIKNLTKDEEYKATTYPEFMQKIVNKGGLLEYTKEKIGGSL